LTIAKICFEACLAWKEIHPFAPARSGLFEDSIINFMICFYCLLKYILNGCQGLFIRFSIVTNLLPLK